MGYFANKLAKNSMFHPKRKILDWQNRKNSADRGQNRNTWGIIPTPAVNARTFKATWRDKDYFSLPFLSYPVLKFYRALDSCSNFSEASDSGFLIMEYWKLYSNFDTLVMLRALGLKNTKTLKHPSFKDFATKKFWHL